MVYISTLPALSLFELRYGTAETELLLGGEASGFELCLSFSRNDRYPA